MRPKQLTECAVEIERLERENQQLREAVTVCAVALKEIDDDLKENMPEYERLDSTNKALAHPAVQAALKEK